jgi:hypothetical protein
VSSHRDDWNKKAIGQRTRYGYGTNLLDEKIQKRKKIIWDVLLVACKQKSKKKAQEKHKREGLKTMQHKPTKAGMEDKRQQKYLRAVDQRIGT